MSVFLNLLIKIHVLSFGLLGENKHLCVHFGFQANTVQSEETISGIKMFLSFLPAVGTILSVVFIAFYPLSETKMKEITATLETKRKETNE